MVSIVCVSHPMEIQSQREMRTALFVCGTLTRAKASKHSKDIESKHSKDIDFGAVVSVFHPMEIQSQVEVWTPRFVYGM